MKSKFFTKKAGDSAQKFIDEVWRTEDKAKRLETENNLIIKENAEGLTEIEPIAEASLPSPKVKG
ncbi:Uncharacterised protein [Legionella lansingensis]|uniref:Uncharacterized protein n=1 Tax=Legionella lansingensis TaxID=45067 RepID=A0A0W0VTL1_9GAMM|nr:hypothetical protein [Legionella lansingensis]KTD23475.1 hypothetical protein Llan_0846 [Legionella lansingensis]SNV50796.1 Uncharacterised protein [Legionella lansingensis]